MKYTALIIMLLDHIRIHLLDNIYPWINYPLHISYLIFLYAIIQGYYKTSDITAYKKRILMLAIISQIPFTLLGHYNPNPIASFYIVLLVVSLADNKKYIYAYLLCLLMFVLPFAGNIVILPLIIPFMYLIKNKIYIIGKVKHKMFFYYFYPVHLMIIYLIQKLI